MNTKEAIDYVESKRYVMEHCDNNKLADEVIELLQRGEKYEAMWGELHPYKEVLVTAKCFITKKYGERSLGTIMYKIKQKYFPKPVDDKDYFYEATSKDPHLKKVKF